MDLSKPFELVPQERGQLLFFDPLPFKAVRQFFIHDILEEEERGHHAHRECQQIITCVAGGFQLLLNTRGRADGFWMRPFMSIFVPRMHWIVLKNFTPFAVASVLADQPYSPPITDPKEFFND